MSDEGKRPLGKILLQKKLVSQQDLDAALRVQNAQKKSHEPQQPLASVLTESGAVGELDALRALSEQHGVPGIDLGQVAISNEHIRLVPREVSERNLIICVLARGERLFLAMANPLDRRVVDEVEFLTGRKVYPYVALTTALRKTITDAYNAAARGDAYFVGPRVPQETLDQLGIGAAATSAGAASPPPPPTLPPAAAAERDARHSRSVIPGAPAVVVDDAIRDAGARAEFGTGDFGALSREISTVTTLPDELRGMGATRPPAETRTHRGLDGNEERRPEGKLVLIVDDEAEIRKLLVRLLTGKGYRVLETDRGQLALRLVREHTPDAIILDAMLPEIHGFDIARRIKGSERYGHIPIVMVSAVYKGWRIAEDIKASYGIDEYLEKPFKLSDILNALGRVLSPSSVPQGQRREVHHSRDPELLHAEAEKALGDGIEAYKRGELDAAIAHLNRGIEIDPLAYRLRFHLALLYGKQGLIYEGIQELEKAVDLNPKHFVAQKNLAVLYEKAGFKHKAVEVWTRCALLAPDEDTRASVKEHLLELL